MANDDFPTLKTSAPGLMSGIGPKTLKALAGQTRQLNKKEQALLKEKFGKSINSDDIRVGYDSSINGTNVLGYVLDIKQLNNITFFSPSENGDISESFIHENTHVWQNLLKNKYTGKSLSYNINKDSLQKHGFKSLGAEQQAEAMRLDMPEASSFIQSHPAPRSNPANMAFLDSIRDRYKHTKDSSFDDIGARLGSMDKNAINLIDRSNGKLQYNNINVNKMENQTKNSASNTTFQGPDGKYYKFPSGVTKDKADAYFKKNPKFQQSKANGAKVTPASHGVSGEYGFGQPINPARHAVEGVKAASQYATDQIPNAAGTIGDTITKSTGGTGIVEGAATAGVLGFAGDLAKTGINKLINGKDFGPTGFWNIERHAAVEGMKQGELAAGGKIIGEALGAAKYIPEKYRMKIVNGVRKLPWETTPSKGMQYIGSLLENLFTSTGLVGKQRVLQTAEVEAAGGKLANAFSKFRGSSDDMGNLVQKSLEQARQTAFSKLGSKPTQDEIAKFNETFFHGLIKDITGGAEAKATVNLASNKTINKTTKKFAEKVVEPSLVAGLIKGSDVEGIRALRSALGTKTHGASLNAAKTQIMKEWLVEASKTGKFVGGDLKASLDKFGEDKGKALFGDVDYNALKKFSEFTKNINGGVSGGIGRWLNYGLGAGIFFSPHKTLPTLFGLRVIGRMMTTEAGTQVLTGFERAVASHAPQAINAAKTAMQTYMQHTAMEQRQEDMRLDDMKKKAEQDYLNSFNQGKGDK